MPPQPTNTEITLYNETFWLTQNGMAELFDVNIPAVSKHLSNIYDEGELEREATVSKMETVQIEGGWNVKRLAEYGLNIMAGFYRPQAQWFLVSTIATELQLVAIPEQFLFKDKIRVF